MSIATRGLEMFTARRHRSRGAGPRATIALGVGALLVVVCACSSSDDATTSSSSGGTSVATTSGGGGTSSATTSGAGGAAVATTSGSGAGVQPKSGGTFRLLGLTEPTSFDSARLLGNPFSDGDV